MGGGIVYQSAGLANLALTMLNQAGGPLVESTQLRGLRVRVFAIMTSLTIRRELLEVA